MFDLLWRMLRKNEVGPSGGEKLPKQRHASFRPQLVALEDRVMPTLGPGGVPVAAPTHPPGGVTASASSSNLQTLTNSPATTTCHMMVWVMQNAPETIINLKYLFAGMNNLQHQDGLQWSMLGNTNAGLVTTDLSESELTLTYTPGQWGTATIKLGATDADGVSEQEIIQVTVRRGEQPSTSTAHPPTGTMGSPSVAA